ncbi:MAG TPA: hypothetical protein VN832_11025 [Stellaceae bacterium]|nr:hypothetical protein [Stellaceae bacterium]
MADLVIAYGVAAVAEAAPRVTIDRARAAPLRLCDGPYPFAEAPDLFRLATVAQQRDFLREHLQSLCNLWDKPARLFLDAYFRRIAAAIEEGQGDLAALAERAGGLFSPGDWSFCALRPLPQAHLLGVRTDFALWTGAALVAIELVGSATPRRRRREELARLRQAEIIVLELPVERLERAEERFLAEILPPAFHRFWAGVALPSSPFAPQTLGEIRGAGADQSSASIT